MFDIYYVDFRDDTAKHLIVDAKDEKEAEDRLIEKYDFAEREYRVLEFNDLGDMEVPSEWTEKG